MGKGVRSWWRRQAIKAKKQRAISGLKWVKAAEPPAFAKGPRRLTGSPARGKAYEGKVAGLLRAQVESGLIKGELYVGPWFQFEDEAGTGMAQPDALLVGETHVFIVEAKLKQTLAAHPQISLYGQLASHLFDKPWVGIQVFRFVSVRRNDQWVENGLREVQDMVEDTTTCGAIFEWHLLG